MLPRALRDIVTDLPRKIGSALRLAAYKVGFSEPPKRLLVGEAAWPYRRAGDVTMDMAFQEFTGKNAAALKEAARTLIPGGRLTSARATRPLRTDHPRPRPRRGGTNIFMDPI